MVNTLKKFTLIKAHRKGKWWIHLETVLDNHKIRLPDEFLFAIRDLIIDGLVGEEGYHKSISLGNYEVHKEPIVEIEVIDEEEKKEEELPEFPE